MRVEEEVVALVIVAIGVVTATGSKRHVVAERGGRQECASVKVAGRKEGVNVGV